MAEWSLPCHRPQGSLEPLFLVDEAGSRSGQGRSSHHFPERFRSCGPRPQVSVPYRGRGRTPSAGRQAAAQMPAGSSPGRTRAELSGTHLLLEVGPARPGTAPWSSTSGDMRTAVIRPSEPKPCATVSDRTSRDEVRASWLYIGSATPMTTACCEKRRPPRTGCGCEGAGSARHRVRDVLDVLGGGRTRRRTEVSGS